MGADTKRVEAEFEGASTCIDGVQFAPLPDAPTILVSEPMPAAKADRLINGVPGFRLCERSPAELHAIDKLLTEQKAAHRASRGDGSDTTREVEELRRANHNQAADIDRLRTENEALLQRIGSGDFARISAERLELQGQVTRLEAELATVKAQGPDVAPLVQERDRLAAEVQRLTEENAALKADAGDADKGDKGKKK